MPARISAAVAVVPGVSLDAAVRVQLPRSAGREPFRAGAAAGTFGVAPPRAGQDLPGRGRVAGLAQRVSPSWWRWLAAAV